MKSKVLVIDDDEELNRLLSFYLGQFEFDVLTASHPTQALQILKTSNPALIILDVMLPGKTGFELCREIRQSSATPIIMLTARGELSDRIVGLELGADDYLPKPYEPRELLARIQSVLRRSQGALSLPKKTVLKSGELLIDLERASAWLSGEDLELTTAEFLVLRLLAENGGQTLSRDDIFQQMRGIQWDSFDRSVDIIVSRLRHKLKDDSKNPSYLKTMWGEGYRFVGSVSNA